MKFRDLFIDKSQRWTVHVKVADRDYVIGEVYGKDYRAPAAAEKMFLGFVWQRWMYASVEERTELITASYYLTPK